MALEINAGNVDEILAALQAAEKLRTENSKAFFKPYPKQKMFLEAGAKYRERLFMAGNQVGKTMTGGYETACHLTGQYPPWWQGKRFKKPIKWWVCGETSLITRDVQQKILCGEPGVEAEFGTGMIPKDCFTDKPSMARGITDAFDTIQVRHVSGGISIARFKSYEQGRTKFQGETLHGFWADEEPEEEIYGEILTRLTSGGIGFITFTPLKGRSKVVLRFLEEQSSDRVVITMSLDEAEHFSAEEKKKRLDGYAIHERDARARGLPILGSGAVFQFSQALITEPIITDIPTEWAKLWGIDFGIDHPFAAVLAAHDRDNDCIHIIDAFRMVGVQALNHATAMKSRAANVPVAWPHDGHARDKGSGIVLAQQYRAHGLSMLQEHATFSQGGYSPEAAVTEITERALSGRFKVAAHLSEWFQEFQLYHRKDGLIVKVEDDLMSATQKIIMMRRFARPVPLGSKVKKRRPQQIAHGVDDYHFGIDA